jgi:hypothetical protein
MNENSEIMTPERENGVKKSDLAGFLAAIDFLKT